MSVVLELLYYSICVSPTQSCYFIPPLVKKRVSRGGILYVQFTREARLIMGIFLHGEMQSQKSI